MEGSTECFDALIGSAAKRLSGYQRRLFLAEVAMQLCDASARCKTLERLPQLLVHIYMQSFYLFLMSDQAVHDSLR